MTKFPEIWTLDTNWTLSRFDTLSSCIIGVYTNWTPGHPERHRGKKITGIVARRSLILPEFLKTGHLDTNWTLSRFGTIGASNISIYTNWTPGHPERHTGKKIKWKSCHQK